MRDKSSEHLASLINTVLDNEAPSDALSEAKLELASLLNEPLEKEPPIEPGERIALRAALYDGGLDEEGRRQADDLFASSSVEVQAALATFDYLDGLMADGSEV